MLFVQQLIKEGTTTNSPQYVSLHSETKCWCTDP